MNKIDWFVRLYCRKGFDLAIQVGSYKDKSLNQKILFKGKRCIVGARDYLAKRDAVRTPQRIKQPRPIERNAKPSGFPIMRVIERDDRLLAVLDLVVPS